MKGLARVEAAAMELYDAIMVLEICALVAVADGRDRSAALWICCRRMRGRYKSKMARRFIQAVASAKMPMHALNLYRAAFDGSTKSVDD
ncbi:hypothetical protein HWC07_gp035 [Pantoea phage vB_PagM_LIET2]|uniref:DUF7740 domain-containing protein n=1 Tax=Pantoea phage vB_PagM_LIET2 TaxID=2508071 RepID=A0A411AW04_9CAUD|nr:hypothetical protein HWC07_gp035 [Pantoea phage vB_PagM_LIET2]QAX92287.1 hypothetical protein LIET2_gp035 [Pantoea phage vB_PagM_LIET2]UJH95935.1 hypothetical protein [Pantoea phage Nafs113]